MKAFGDSRPGRYDNLHNLDEVKRLIDEPQLQVRSKFGSDGSDIQGLSMRETVRVEQSVEAGRKDER